MPKKTSSFVPMFDIIPEGKSGNAKVGYFTVSDEEAERFNLRNLINKKPEFNILPGKYTRLLIDGEVVMSDTPFEQRTNQEVVEAAKGNVLIAGLGIGMILVPILQNPRVESVTVVEKSADVAALVYTSLVTNGPFTADERMKLVMVVEDISNFIPKPKYFNTIYFDIWPSVKTDNLISGEKLKKQFRKHLKPGGWMKMWVEKDLRKRKVKEDKELEFHRTRAKLLRERVAALKTHSGEKNA